MRYKVEKGKTLLIDGPTRVQLISGAAEVLGAEIKSGMSIIVREGKRLPFEANPEFEAELFIGGQASCTEISGAAIPDSWRKTAARILSEKDRSTVLILGGVDSGKTGFSVYLANSALKTERKVAVIDCDLGQSDLGPPGTISLCFVEKPLTDLFRLFPSESIFIGVTSPSGVVNEVLEAAKKLKDESLKENADLLIVNTDGWIDGEDAIKYKANLVKAVNPDYIVAIQVKDELDPLISSLEEPKIIVVDSPANIKKRDRKTRRLLRGFAYKKHLRGSKIRCFPLSWVKVEGSLNLTDEKRDDLKEKMQKFLGTEIIYCEETSKCIICVVREKTGLTEDAVKEVEAKTGKRVLVFQKGDEKGLIVSLESRSGKMLGIGTLHCVDFKNKIIKIRTPVDTQVSKIKVGQIKLDYKGNEEGIILSDFKQRLKDTDD